MDDKMIGYCGIDCENCDTYIATKNNDNELRKKVATLWSKLNNVEIKPEWINCTGCKSNGIISMYCQKICEIRKCAMNQNDSIKNHTCAKCPKMEQCQKLKVITDHNENAKTNLLKG